MTFHLSSAARGVLFIACAMIPFFAADAQRGGGQRGAPVPPRPQTMAGKSPVYAPNGVAATSQPLATNAAIRVMQNGGNAIAAAVTAAAVLSVVEPMMTGIGGDMFAIVWVAKEHKLVALNASGRAGSLMTVDEFKKRGQATIPR